MKKEWGVVPQKGGAERIGRSPEEEKKEKKKKRRRSRQLKVPQLEGVHQGSTIKRPDGRLVAVTIHHYLSRVVLLF
jgi:hypothetical protein